MASMLALCLLTLSSHLFPAVHAIPATLLPAPHFPFIIGIDTNLTFSSPLSNLHAPPPPNFHIDGSSYLLPHRYRISFEHYGPPASPTSAAQCLHKAALEMHTHAESEPMGPQQRVYGYQDVTLGIKPARGMTWGYWGAALRAVDSMWRSWDVVELEFVVGVEEVGVVGRGFLRGVEGEGVA